MRHAESAEDLVRPEALRDMTGLAFMQAMLEGRLPHPPISRVLGYRLHSVGDGRAVFRGTPGFDVTNPLGSVHGGWYGTLLDSAMACAITTRLPAGRTHTTLEYKINIVRPVPTGTEIACEGICEHHGRSTAVARGSIRGVADGRLYATGSTTCIIFELPPPG